MRRRDFIAGLGSTAAWPFAGAAQQSLTPTIGFLNSGSPEGNEGVVKAVRNGLSEGGFIEGANVAVDYRWAEGKYDRLSALAGDLVRRNVSVLVATGGSNSALAAKAATATIPIVFAVGGDPIMLGLVASFNRPGGNTTGIYVFDATMEAKRLGFLRELVPTAGVIAVLLNPTNANYEAQAKDVEQGARAAGQQVQILKASNDQEREAAFAALLKLRAGALLIGADPITRFDLPVALAARHSVPTFYPRREFVEAGGLASYATSLKEAYRQVGLYTALRKSLRARNPPIYRCFSRPNLS